MFIILIDDNIDWYNWAVFQQVLKVNSATWSLIREVKHDVNGRRQTAKTTSDFESFSSKP